MRSPQIVRLQQQFLASLHDKPRQWLLDQIEPAPGFKDSEEVLEIYLHRAMARTVEPLNDIYQCLRWVIGDDTFNQFVKQFYADSLGEPLNAQALSTEFAAYIGNIGEEARGDIKIAKEDSTKDNYSNSIIIEAAAMLDWRIHWVTLVANKRKGSAEELTRQLNHRNSIWLRPRLNSASRLCYSGVDLKELNRLAAEEAIFSFPTKCSEGVSTFLIYANQNHNAIVRPLDTQEARLLNHCDGTHTIASLIHEGKFFDQSKKQTLELIKQLIDEGVICDLENNLT
jgi:hypothetical protein